MCASIAVGYQHFGGLAAMNGTVKKGINIGSKVL
jgi:hypothetical protein